MYCKKCGKVISEGSKFCRYCGAKITPDNSRKDHEKNEHEHGNNNGGEKTSQRNAFIGLGLVVFIFAASIVLFLIFSHWLSDDSSHQASLPGHDSPSNAGVADNNYLLNGMEQEGQYNLVLYSTDMEATDNGTIVFAELMTICTMTDEEAYQILKSEPGSYYTNQGEYEEIMWSEGFLRKNSGDAFWREFWPSDSPKMEVHSSGYVFIPDDAVFIDNMSAIMFGINRDVSSLYELFHLASQDFTYDYEQIDASVTVTNGIITTVDMYYSP